MRKVLGWWKADVCRHSFISYAMACPAADIGRLATECGNSVGIIGRHYLALVPREQAARFWSLMP
jgi:hypothetical protein